MPLPGENEYTIAHALGELELALLHAFAKLLLLKTARSFSALRMDAWHDAGNIS